MSEFPVSGPITAEIRVGAGRVQVTGAPGATVATAVVEPLDDSDLARDCAARTVVEMRGDRLYVKTPEIATGWLRRRSASVAITVTVPTGSSLELKAASADVTVTGELRKADVTSASGDLSIERITEQLSVNTASGDLRAGAVGGDLKVISASGDITVDTVDGHASLHSASGDFHIGSAGNGVRANTASGDVMVGVLRRGAAKVTSASGDIRIGVAPGTGVWQDLHSMSGRTRSELDPAGPPTGGGEPEVTLQLRSMSGDVTLGRFA
ncbi:MAG: DUF4097 family beta strand repeat protein [Hamadaea sp.]|nr:DUF4097 family beta strand repeat protein [Hamadaea sp.]